MRGTTDVVVKLSTLALFLIVLCPMGRLFHFLSGHTILFGCAALGTECGISRKIVGSTTIHLLLLHFHLYSKVRTEIRIIINAHDVSPRDCTTESGVVNSRDTFPWKIFLKLSQCHCFGTLQLFAFFRMIKGVDNPKPG